jgi:hypothetical protein
MNHSHEVLNIGPTVHHKCGPNPSCLISPFIECCAGLCTAQIWSTLKKLQLTSLHKAALQLVAEAPDNETGFKSLKIHPPSIRKGFPA